MIKGLFKRKPAPADAVIFLGAATNAVVIGTILAAYLIGR